MMPCGDEPWWLAGLLPWLLAQEVGATWLCPAAWAVQVAAGWVAVGTAAVAQVVACPAADALVRSAACWRLLVAAAAGLPWLVLWVAAAMAAAGVGGPLLAAAVEAAVRVVVISSCRPWQLVVEVMASVVAVTFS
jgi:hypothetical protein